MTRPIKRACVRDRWAAQVWRTHAASTGCRFVLAYMANAKDSQGRHLMTERGYWKQPQADTCAALGLSDRRLRDRLTEAVDVGLLTRNGGGYRGQTVTFLAQLVGEPKPTERRRTGAAFQDEKGGGRVPPLGTEKGGGLQPSFTGGRVPPFSAQPDARKAADGGPPYDARATTDGTDGNGTDTSPTSVRMRVAGDTLPPDGWQPSKNGDHQAADGEL